MKFQTAYGEPYSGPECVVDCSCEESKVQQHFADQCDINRIVSQFERTGTVDHLSNVAMRYEDVSTVPQYREALDIVRAAELSFAALPGEVRSRFGNDPAQMLDFLQHPENVDEAVRLGLVVKPKEEAKAVKEEKKEAEVKNG